MVKVCDKDGGALFRPAGQSTPRSNQAGRRSKRTAGSVEHLDWLAEAERFTANLSRERLEKLASELNVTPRSLEALGVGWADAEDLRRMRAGGDGWQQEYPNGAYTFPERDGGGRVVGLSLRTLDGRKGFPSGKVGARRGLVIPATLAERPDPVLCVEGASDVAACEVLRVAAVGRPSCFGGAEDTAALLDGREVLVVGERDAKATGGWPGRDGARRTAERLANEWDTAVPWTLPPTPAKDIRSWLKQQLAAGLILSDSDACASTGAALLNALRDAAKEVKPEKAPSQSEMIVRLALELYRLGTSATGETFAVELAGPNVALMFRGSRDALRAVLAREYRRRYARTPNASALSDALTVLQGEAQDCQPELLHLRLARHDDGIVIDLGDPDGRAVFVRPQKWEILEMSPVLFRRTALIGVLPEPERGGDLALMRELLNVGSASWPLLLGWQIAALIPDLPHPILMLGGLHGTGKSTTAKVVVDVVDPSPAPLRSPPKDPEQWAIAAAGSWAVIIDNVSSIPGWWSDALCKAVTGDGWIRRKLYTDSDLAVLSFRRVIVLTSIDAGALRGDLGDRLLLVDLEEIDDEQRMEEALLQRLQRERRGLIFGALLDLLAQVLERLPAIHLLSHPRMADFARVQAAVDEVLGTEGLTTYFAQRDRIAGDVLDGDPVATAVISLMQSRDVWEGSPTSFHDELLPEKPPKGWPKTAPVLSGRLKRLAPALKTAGIRVHHVRSTSRGRSRLIRIEKTPDSAVRAVRPSDEEVPRANQARPLCRAPDAEDTSSDGAPPELTSDLEMPATAVVQQREGVPDAPDGSDGRFLHQSGREVIDL